MILQSSCCHVWDNIKIPMVFINSLDDPIVPPQLLEKVKLASARRDNFLYVEQKYGGHLGFYEGGLVYPKPLTWLDRLVVQLSDALVAYTSDGKLKSGLESSTEEDESYSSGGEESGGSGSPRSRSKSADEQQDSADDTTSDFSFFQNRHTKKTKGTVKATFTCKKRTNFSSRKGIQLTTLSI